MCLRTGDATDPGYRKPWQGSSKRCRPKIRRTVKGGKSDIWVVGSEGGPARRLTTHPAVDALPQWSRDDQWIYFASQRSGRHEAWKVPAPGDAAPVPVTEIGDGRVEESVDGKFLYFTKPAGVLWRMPAAGGEATPVLGEIVNASNWVLGEKGIYILDREARPLPAIQLLDPETEELTTVAGLDKQVAVVGGGGQRSSISPNDEWLVYDSSAIEEDIMLLENFR